MSANGPLNGHCAYRLQAVGVGRQPVVVVDPPLFHKIISWQKQIDPTIIRGDRRSG